MKMDKSFILNYDIFHSIDHTFALGIKPSSMNLGEMKNNMNLKSVQIMVN